MARSPTPTPAEPKAEATASLNVDAVIFAVILVVAMALRLADIKMPLIDAFSWREASTAMMADNFYQVSWNIFYPEVSWTGPLAGYQGRELQIQSYLTAIMYTVFGWHDWFGRLISFFFGLVTLFSTYGLALETWDRRHAQFAAMIYAILPAAVMIDSSFLPDATMLGLVTFGLWLFVRYWKGTETRKLLVLATLCFTLGALSKLPGLAAGLIVVWLLGHWIARGQTRRALLVVLAMATGLAVVFGYYAWAVYLGTNYPPFHVAGQGFVWDVGLRYFLDEAYFIDSLQKIAQYWFYGPAVGFLAVIGFWTAPRASSDPALAFLPHVWLAGSVLIYLAAAGEMVDNPWNLHIATVPIAMFAGRGALILCRSGAEGANVWSVARAVCLFAIIYGTATVPLLKSMKGPYAEKSLLLGQQLAAVSEPGDLVITVATTVGDPSAIYYSRRRGWTFPPGGGEINWSRFRDDDRAALDDFEELKSQGADWFGIATNAKDAQGLLFVEHHAGLITLLRETAVVAAETNDYIIFELSN
jgi:4-amino-4-deoxy-L-arabinose transferase-like glycosyltransferase